jgi:hypothetical protein
VLENRVLRRIIGPKRDEVVGDTVKYKKFNLQMLENKIYSYDLITLESRQTSV